VSQNNVRLPYDAVPVDGITPEALAQKMAEAGLTVREVRPIRPSLEDVFVSRIKSQARY
jgi:hypothetical protein